jgi:outer membrane protein TolC
MRVGVSQTVPWFGKLGARASIAEAETNMARAELAGAELEVVDQVKQAYYDLYFIQQAIRITEEDRNLLVDLTRIAEGRYRTGEVSQQDVLRAQVEVSSLESELIRLRQELASSQARLAELVHISPDTPLRALDQLAEEEIPQDLDRLYRQAVSARPELHTQLAAIQRDRFNIELARLAYRPDFNLSVDWAEMTTRGAMAPTADGVDDVGIGVMVNLPIYRHRLDAMVRSAEAQTVSSARKYDALRDRTLKEVKDLFVQATSQYQLTKLFRDDIIPKAGQTLEVSRSAYQVGKVDFLQLVDNWRRLLQYRIMHRRLESQLRQTVAALERVVGGELPMLEREEPVAAPVGNAPPIAVPEPAEPPAPPVPPKP